MPVIRITQNMRAGLTRCLNSTKTNTMRWWLNGEESITDDETCGGIWKQWICLWIDGSEKSEMGAVWGEWDSGTSNNSIEYWICELGIKPGLFTNARTIQIRGKVVFAELLKVTHQTASSLIRDLEDLQILKKWEKIGRSQLYVFGRYFALFLDWTL